MMSTRARIGRSRGDGDPPEHPPLAGAVHLARLVDRARDRLQAREDEQGRVPHVPPHVDDRDGGNGQRRGEEVRLGTRQGFQELVGDTQGVVQDPQPQHGGDHVGDQVGRQHDRAHEGGLGQALHEDGDEERQDRLETDVDDHVLHGDDDGVPEGVVLGHALVVVQAGELLGGQEVVLGEGQPDASEERPDVEGDESDRRREDEGEAELDVGARLALPTRLSRDRGRG